MNRKTLSSNYALGKYRQRGSMLISVLFIMVVLAGLMAAMSTVSSQSSQQLVYEVQALKARLAAESILEKQIFVSLNEITTSSFTPTQVTIESEKINGCDTKIHPLELITVDEVNKLNIIASGECRTGQLTVIRNIEVEVIDNEN